MQFDLSPLWISLKTASLATLITFFLGIAAAYWMIDYRGKAKALIEGFFISPLVLPPTVVGFLLLLLFGKNGPIGLLLQYFGVTLIFSWPATLIAATVVAFPLMYKTAYAAFEQIDGNILHAARTLGASEGTVFWQVTLPLATPGIMAGTILAFARALGEFGATLMLAGNIPGKTETIPMAIFFAVEAGNMGEALVWVLIILAISLGAITLVNFWSKLQHLHQKPLTIHREAVTLDSGFSTTDSGLFLEIHKDLSSFKLSVAFSTDHETLGILGASGSGKSMTLRCIAGLETPSSGRIVLNGKVLFDSQKGINLPSSQRQIGFLFQNYALFPHMTVAQNIAFGLQKLPKSERQRRVAEQLLRVQLQGMEDRYPHQLSGGQQQRIALARSLAIEPAALLLDEPFCALDTHLRSQMEKQLISLITTYQGVTLFVTHNLEEAYRVCKNLLVLSEGKAIATGPKENIFERPANFTVAQLTGCKNFSQARALSPQLVEAVDWGCTLQIIEPLPKTLTYVGIRANHLVFTADPTTENTFPVWLVQTSETPHRVTLYLKLYSPPSNLKDYNLEAEVPKEKWTVLKDRPLPWLVHFNPLRLFLMES